MADLKLAQIIAAVESDNNPHAMRFEVATFQRAMDRPEIVLRVAEQNHRCSHDTARIIYATSWGLYQIMGFNLYDPAGYEFTGDIVSYLLDEEEQLLSLQAFLERKDIDFTVQEIIDDPVRRSKFITAYNGPGDTDGYWQRMREVIGV